MLSTRIRLWHTFLAAALLYATAAGAAYLFQAYPRHRVESAWIALSALLVATALARWTSDLGRVPAVIERRLLPAAIGAAFLLYAPSLSVGFLSDDFSLIAASDRWDLAPAAWEHFRPLSLGVWALLLDVGVRAPIVFHAINIALHGMNAWLTCRLAGELGLSARASMFAGALFLVFPGSVEPVTWASSFQDVLMAALVLGFLLAAARAKTWPALALLAAATLAKETAVCAPVLLLVLRPGRRAGRGLVIASVAWIAVFAAARLFLKPAEGVFEPVTTYFLKELLVRIYGGLAVPWTIAQITAYPWLASAAVMAIAACVAALLARSEKAAWTTALVLAAGILVTALPVYRYLYVSPDLQGSRYLYLPSAIWSVFLAFLAFQHGAAVRRAVLAVLLLSSTAGVFMQQQRWREAARVRDAVLAQAMGAARAHGCSAPAFNGAPDSHAGAYVFRNGLSEAVAMELGLDRRAPADCSFFWNGSSFDRATRPPAPRP